MPLWLGLHRISSFLPVPKGLRASCTSSVAHWPVLSLPFPLPHLSPQFDIQHTPHQASVPPALLFLARLAFLPAPSVHLPLCSDRGGHRRGWRGLTHSGSGGSVAPLGLVQGALREKSQSLSPGDSRLFSAGWEGGGVICVSQLPQSSQLFPQN